MPSLDENFPSTVFECLSGQVPFIASRVGGIPEMISPQHVEDITFHPNAQDLEAKISDIMQHGVLLTPQQYDVNNIINTFDEYHRGVKQIQLDNRLKANNNDDNIQDTSKLPFISVVMVSYNQDTFLREAIESLENQDYPQEKFELILVDSGSQNVKTNQTIADLAPLFQKRGWQVLFSDISQHRKGEAAASFARNLGVDASRGEYIMFMDDDNVALPFELQYFGKGIVFSGADILTTSQDFCYEDECKDDLRSLSTDRYKLPQNGRMIFAGASAGGACANRMGDTYMIVKKTSFEHIGGFSKSLTMQSYADWELLLRASMFNLKVESVPMPLFLKRDRSNNLMSAMDNDSDFDRKSEIFKMLGERLPQSFVDAMKMGCQLNMDD